MSPEQWQAQLERALVRVGVVKAIGGALQTAALRSERAAKLSVTASGSQRSGRLRSSIRGLVRPVGTQDAEIVTQAGGHVGGADVVYARVQEYGGVIRPVRAKYLAIPIHPATITPAGVSRYRSPRDVPEELTFITSKAGNKLLINEAGEPYYVLYSSVNLKARRFLRDGRDAALKRLGPDIAKELTKLIKPGGTNA